MPKGKTEVVSVRVEPSIKAALKAAADQERRSMASMLEVMVLAYCKSHEIPVPDSQSGSASEESK